MVRNETKREFHGFIFQAEDGRFLFIERNYGMERATFPDYTENPFQAERWDSVQGDPRWPEEFGKCNAIPIRSNSVISVEIEL